MTRSVVIFASLTFLLFLAAAQPADGGGLRDMEDAWLGSPHAVVALLADAPQVAQRWQVRLGHGRLHGMSELEQSGLELERRWRSGVLAVGWQRLGSDLYRESTWRASLLAGPSWRVGGRIGISALDIAGQRLSQEIEADLLLVVPLSGEILLQAWWPLTRAPLWYGQYGLRRWLMLHGGGGQWIWAAAIDRNSDGAPSLQGEILLKVAAQAALGLRCEPATGTVGICTAWRAPGFVLRTSHSLHPDLGPSHRWGLVLGGGQ